MIETIPAAYRCTPDALADRVVLVTGASGGIGRAVSVAAAAHGATVVLVGRSIRKLESVYDEIAGSGGPDPAIYPLELAGASPSDYDELAERVQAELGALHGVVHSAAELGTLGSLEHQSLEDWLGVLQVNVNAAFLLTRACLALMRISIDGSIVFTSDDVGRRGRAYWGPYGVSKFAIEGLVQILADELEGNTEIRVNALNPGPVRTRLRANAYPAEDPALLRSAHDVVGAYLYLLGPDAVGVSGRSFDLE